MELFYTDIPHRNIIIPNPYKTTTAAENTMKKASNDKNYII
jgi:hypothetical protein